MQDYFNFWNIQRPVFMCQNIERDFFVCDSHEGVFKRVTYFCQQGSPLLLVSSPCGHGKSTLARWIYHHLPTSTHEVLILSLIESPNARGWLTAKISAFFGYPEESLEANPLVFLDELIEENKKLVIIIDNAQHIQDQLALDEIASFLHQQSFAQNHVSFLLLSETTMKPLIEDHPIARQVKFAATLSTLSLDECRAFVQFQLSNQHLAPDVFTDDAIYILHDISAGNFAQIAAIAENCLMEAFIQQDKVIKPSCVIKAAAYVVNSNEQELRTRYAPLPLPAKPGNIPSPTSSAKAVENIESKIKLMDLLADKDAS